MLQTQHLGRTDYAATLRAMQQYTANRGAETPDTLWLTEHAPVYTLGLNRQNVRMPSNQIPVELVDRGGKITYHGPGQVVIYTLLDLKRLGINVRQCVSLLENSIIELLSEHNVTAYAKKDAPGVYVNEAKIASLGLRLKNQCCYHGLSLNVGMDLSPFSAIDPCGYAGLQVTQTKDLDVSASADELGQALLAKLENHINALI